MWVIGHFIVALCTLGMFSNFSCHSTESSFSEFSGSHKIKIEDFLKEHPILPEVYKSVIMDFKVHLFDPYAPTPIHRKMIEWFSILSQQKQFTPDHIIILAYTFHPCMTSSMRLKMIAALKNLSYEKFVLLHGFFPAPIRDDLLLALTQNFHRIYMGKMHAFKSFYCPEMAPRDVPWLMISINGAPPEQLEAVKPFLEKTLAWSERKELLEILFTLEPLKIRIIHDLLLCRAQDTDLLHFIKKTSFKKLRASKM
jgi:hypothetical protein